MYELYFMRNFIRSLVIIIWGPFHDSGHDKKLQMSLNGLMKEKESSIHFIKLKEE